MSSPNHAMAGLPGPLSAPRPHCTIMIHPTGEQQRFYNQTRQELNKQSLENHVAREDRLGPPQAEPMSRSTTNDSPPSPSTVYSCPGDSTMSMYPNPLPSSVSKGQRGRRKGPLTLEKRIKTAFKRKFKLTCGYHRNKRTSCDCHDFSMLEEGYNKFLARDQQRDRAPRAAAVRPFGDLGTFGTGGASSASPAIAQHYPGIDLPGSPTSYGPQSRVHAGLMPFVELNIDSAASVNATIVSAQREVPPYLAPTALLPESNMQDPNIDNRVPIGCSTLSGDKWECKYQYMTDETASMASTESCSWKGRFDDLRNHYYSKHQPFQPANPPYTSACLECSAMNLGLTEQRLCENPDRCSPGSWRKWYWGVTTPSLAPAPRGVTASEASGSRFSYADSSWNMMSMPGSRHVGQYGFAYSSSNYSGFYEHSTCGKEVEEGTGGDNDDDEGKRDAWHRSGGQRNCSKRRFDATEIVCRCAIRHCLSLVKARWGTSRCAPRDPQPCAPPPSPPPPSPHWRRILPLLILFGLAGELLAGRVQVSFLALMGGYCLTWYLTFLLIGLAIVGLGAGSMAIGYLETRMTRETNGFVSAPIV